MAALAAGAAAPVFARPPEPGLAFARGMGVLSNAADRAIDPVLALRSQDWAAAGIDLASIDVASLVGAVHKSGPDQRRWKRALVGAWSHAGRPEQNKAATLARIERAAAIAVAREAAVLRSLGPEGGKEELPPILGVGQRPVLPATAPLLASAIAAHGGSDRWSAIRSFSTHMSIGGGLFSRKGKAGVLSDIVVDGDTRSAFSRLTGVGEPDRRIIFTPGELTIEWADGRTIERRIDPVAAFQGHSDETPWDDVHLGYFCGYANWNYLVVPFAFAGEGFETEELPSVTSAGEIWRRLRVRFPASFPTHGTEQIYYFDDRYLLRRLDYFAPLAGSGHVAHFCDDHRIFDGIVVPTTRRAYRMDAEGNVMPRPLAIDIRITATRFS